MSDAYHRDVGECRSLAELFAEFDSSGVEGVRTLHARRLVFAPRTGLGGRLDVFGPAAACSFARIVGHDGGGITLVLPGAYSVTTTAAGGWLMQPQESRLGSYWLPQSLFLRRFDSAGHILEERLAQVSRFACASEQTDVSLCVPKGWVLDFPVWQFRSGSQGLSSELQNLDPVETQSRFLWGSHTLYRRPGDVYLHLIGGRVYENRATWPKHWKIFSENDAHALYTVLGGLACATGKDIYRLLQRQLVLSVLERQGEDGAWRHGEWTDHMEVHLRLHCSAMHLLMDELAHSHDPTIARSLARAADFLSRQADCLKGGTWLLHDELERSLESLQEGPFRWVASRALGKSPSNMLVLNSHLDATIALDRYGEVCGDARHAALVRDARRATRTVMCLRPAEWLYRLIFRAIRLTFLPSATGAALPWHLRVVKRFAWKRLIPLLPRVKAWFPRLVMPGGYIDRELSLRMLAHDYLPINVMDLLRYRRRFPDEPNDVAIREALGLIAECRMYERWPEIGKAYAIGFWAEALYQACLAYPQTEFRAQLAQAVRELEKRGLGLPPSLLGANAEALASHAATPLPLTEDARLRVVNLCTAQGYEILVVNCADVGAPVRMSRNGPREASWMLGSSQAPLATLPDALPPGAWLWGRSTAKIPADV